MSIKTLTRIKIFAMIIVPIITEITLVWLEWLRALPVETMIPVHAALYILIFVSSVRYIRRCKECGAWHAVKEISREEINRMEHPQKSTKRKMYQVRYNVIKRCKYCSAERLYEIIKEIKEK